MRSVILPSLALFLSGSASDGIAADLGSSNKAEGRRLAANYALIAAMSGWTPMMFMTRVRL